MLKNCDLWQHRHHKLSSSSLQIFSLMCGSGHCWPGPRPLAGLLLPHPPKHSVSVSLHLPALAAASQRTTRALSSLTLIIIYASVVRWGFTRLFPYHVIYLRWNLCKTTLSSPFFCFVHDLITLSYTVVTLESTPEKEYNVLICFVDNFRCQLLSGLY